METFAPYMVVKFWYEQVMLVQERFDLRMGEHMVQNCAPLPRVILVTPNGSVQVSLHWLMVLFTK